jgi:hypothetical protein
VRVTPVLQSTVPFSLLVGEPGIDFVVRTHGNLGRLHDAQRIVVPVENDGLRTDLGQGGTLGLVFFRGVWKRRVGFTL